MAKTNLPLRAELDGVWYLDAHPQVAEHFKTAGVYRYCEKLTSFHRQIAEIFAQGYNGRTVKIGPEEFHIDEAAIAECTELPRTESVGLRQPIPLMLSSGHICCQPTVASFGKRRSLQTS